MIHRQGQHSGDEVSQIVLKRYIHLQMSFCRAERFSGYWSIMVFSMPYRPYPAAYWI